MVVVVVVLSPPTGAPAGGEEETGLGPNPGEPPPAPSRPNWDSPQPRCGTLGCAALPLQ